MVEVSREHFEQRGWRVHSFELGGTDVAVLQQEPFRWRWVATKLCTFVFVIPRTPPDYESILADLPALREFAGRHKRSWLPFGLQCGYALLPIYVGTAFPDPVRCHVRETFRKRWCVFHVPSLLDESTGELDTLEHKSFWGTVYRGFINEVTTDVARVLTVR